MEKTIIINKLSKIITETLHVPQESVKEDSEFNEDLESDSMLFTEIIMRAEDLFDIRIPDNEAERFRTVGEVADYIFILLNGTQQKYE